MRGPLQQFRTLQAYARNIGWNAALRYRVHEVMVYRFNSQADFEIQLNLKNATYPLKMRTGKNSSDWVVLHDIFICPQFEPVTLTNPTTIIDLGANVGYSSAYFLSRYPSAKVVAVEPDPENFLLCKRNLAPFGARAIVLRGAAWPESRVLAVKKGVHGDERGWATQVCPPSDLDCGDPIVQGYDVDSLIALAGSHEIDLLKIDIEGSERELFSRNTAMWMPSIRNICIELHGEECAAVFFSSLSEYTFESSCSGELTICSNLRHLPTHVPPR